MSAKTMERLPFTVDSALLRELGERLIGKHHVAVGELVKNSYDADANEVLITFDPDEDLLEVLDDGHGMTYEDFKRFWMRIGNPYKAEQGYSRDLRRPLTGSKGVGRLSVQLLAHQLKVQSVTEGAREWIEADVDWSEAVEVDKLTEVYVNCYRRRSKPPFPKGTSITLGKLKHPWDVESVVQLAREIWWLEPPFRASSTSANERTRFDIVFASPKAEYEEAFGQQIVAVMDNWITRVVGECRDGTVNIAVEYAGEAPIAHSYRVADFPHNKGEFRQRDRRYTEDEVNLHGCTFEIRVFRLSHRQPSGIKVGDARDYFAKYGGVHVYDGGFHLPYYGNPENDWLKISYDQSRRLTRSQLLPESLQVVRGMNQLPGFRRLFGVVNVDTGKEPGLRILVTRDRLAETAAFEDLRSIVRYALDYYAVTEARRKAEEAVRKKPIEPATRKFQRVEEVLEEYEGELPEQIFQDLGRNLHEATIAAEDEKDALVAQIGLIAPLATAGIAAVAYQHELTKQFAFIEEVAVRLRKVRSGNAMLDENMQKLASDLQGWLERAKATNALFDALANPENARNRDRLNAKSVIREIRRQTRFLARSVEVNVQEVADDMRLPAATFVEWSAVFQNVFINAFSAMLDSRRRLLKISSSARQKRRHILVQDTGKGVDLKRADELFKPFVRRLKISPERRALGYGGTGLGLTIVRLVAENLGCTVSFVRPESSFKTAFQLSWSER